MNDDVPIDIPLMKTPSYINALKANAAPQPTAALLDVKRSQKTAALKDGKPAFLHTEEFSEPIENCNWLAVLKSPQKRPHTERIRDVINQEWRPKEAATVCHEHMTSPSYYIF